MEYSKEPSRSIIVFSFFLLNQSSISRSRYSESMSSNPRLAAMPAAKRFGCVAPEVDLGECTLHLPLQKANKAEPTLALKPRGDVTRNPKQRPQKRTCVSAKNIF